MADLPESSPFSKAQTPSPTAAAGSGRLVHRLLVSAGVAAALVAGAVSLPQLTSGRADAQQIVVAPPAGAPMSFANLIERVAPAVVSIEVRQRPGGRGQAIPNMEQLPPGFEDFFRPGPRQRGPAPTSLGSGFFIAANGTIVTNHHVVEDAEDITIRLSDGREIKADLVGSDEPTDIAVLRIRGGGSYPFVRFDRQAQIRVGDWVVAVGNPFGLSNTATAGIVSAKGRREFASAYVDFLQMDAPINPGNSGGPAFDLQGRVIGVNSAILSRTGQNAGIGFAIPADTAARIVDQIMERGRVTRGWLGVQIQPLDDDLGRSLGLENGRGALVASIIPESPAATSGLRQGDVIVRMNGQPIEDQRTLTQRIGETPVGQSVRFDIVREGREQTISVRLAERPAETALAPAPEAPEADIGLGLEVRPLTEAERSRYELNPGQNGLLITSIDPDSDLFRKGVRRNDLIISAGDRPVTTPEELQAALTAARAAGRPLLLLVETPGRGRRFVAAAIEE